MKRTPGLFSLVAVVAGLLVMFMAGVVLAQGYKTYCNARFGFCVDYPVRFGMEPAPANNDGRVFYDREGFRMTVSGMNNVMEETLESARQAAEEEVERVTYRAGGSNWFVLSGYTGEEIVYLKKYVGRGSMNTLYLRYPARLQGEYGSMVTRISRSFRPGGLGEAR